MRDQRRAAQFRSVHDVLDIPGANEMQCEIKDVQHSSGQYHDVFDIPAANEVQCEIKDVQHSSGQYMMY